MIKRSASNFMPTCRCGMCVKRSSNRLHVSSRAKVRSTRVLRAWNQHVMAVKGGSATDRKCSGACSWRAHDGECDRAEERMSTGVVESPVNRVISTRCCKTPQMAWMPRGAHLRLPIRTRVVNGNREASCRERSPGFRVAPPPAAARPPMIKRAPMADRSVPQRRHDLIFGVRT